MILWLWPMSSSQFAPRTENSIGKPRWAVRPCWERSWMTARMPGMEFSSRRRMAPSSLTPRSRFLAGTRVRL